MFYKKTKEEIESEIERLKEELENLSFKDFYEEGEWIFVSFHDEKWTGKPNNEWGDALVRFSNSGKGVGFSYSGSWTEEFNLSRTLGEWKRLSHKATDGQVKERLIEEALRRYKTGQLLKPVGLNKGGDNGYIFEPVGFNYYASDDDNWCALFCNNNHLLYDSNDGWAKLDDSPTHINGHEIRFIAKNTSYVKIGCETVPKGTIGNFAKYAQKYNLRIMRDGEDITDDIINLSLKI